MNLIYIELIENLIDEKRNVKNLKTFAESVKSTFSNRQLSILLKRCESVIGCPVSLTFGLSTLPLVVETKTTSKGVRRGLWSFSVYTDDESPISKKRIASAKRVIRDYMQGYNDEAKLSFQTFAI